MDTLNKKPLKLNIVEDNKKPLKLNVVDENKKPLKLNIVDDVPQKLNIVDDVLQKLIEHPSDHMCYILKSLTTKKLYVGYTVDFNRRLRQHNGEIVGGAKKTEKGRPWEQICEIKGFYDKSSALRFEWRIQHAKNPRPNCVANLLIILRNLLYKGDGLLLWPSLTIKWI